MSSRRGPEEQDRSQYNTVEQLGFARQHAQNAASDIPADLDAALHELEVARKTIEDVLAERDAE